ncbi:hypothetical protein DL766_004248 [Monosporascus sp. MC13-8B]|uniref:60S ribosome subunit biogenesis protein NIP7 n=1 Tax=Monosporascus cannonballus TaxID=155416 RepID=A0ABY0GS04_9PEZI|nr:hypothetical protein DL762_009926 [Monosporascus cannonballus]RYO81877.1 hypothetical protein DL763_008432 [Monosporascus cannonballus]RYP31799.1 hypothetical protein DL766_004248 [Monosporascus sp. MC13-8B]
MRPLTEPETKVLFDKLANYTGSSLKNLIAPLDDSPDADRYVFRLHKDRVYYVLLSIANLATSVARENLSSLGVCLGTISDSESPPRHHLPPWSHTGLGFGTSALTYGLIGRFTKSGKFRLHITALPILAEHARYKIWIRSNGEMPFLYGGNVVKAHVGRFTEDTPEHQGVVVLSMDDKPLGFGVTAADCGEYLRDEDTLFTG